METGDKNEIGAQMEGVVLPRIPRGSKIKFLIPSKTLSGETSKENLRMVSGLPLEPPKPSQRQPRLPLDLFLPKGQFLSRFNLLLYLWSLLTIFDHAGPAFPQCSTQKDLEHRPLFFGESLDPLLAFLAQRRRHVRKATLQTSQLPLVDISQLERSIGSITRADVWLNSPMAHNAS